MSIYVNILSIFEQNGANQWCYANDRQHATTGHAPARATFLTESTRLSLSFPLPGIPSSDSPSPTFSYSRVPYLSHFLFSFFLFSFSPGYPLPLFIHPSFLRLVRSNSFQPESSISLRYPHPVCTSFSFTIFICQMIFQSILKIFHPMINVY